MKILYVVQNLMLGGVEKVSYELISHLNRDMYQIDILVANDESSKDYYEPKLLALGCRIFKGGYIIGKDGKRAFLRFEKQLLQREHYDVVHSHLDFMNAWTLRVAKRCGVSKRISHVHCTYPDKDSWGLLRKLKYLFQKQCVSHYANVKIGCGTQVAKDHYTGKYQVLYNGMDESKFITLPTESKAETEILVIARIVQDKNPLFICDVLYELTKIDDAYKLIWVGRGEMMEQVRNKITQYQLEKNIQLVGATAAVTPYMELCSMALLPSISEGLPISLVETQLAHCFTFYSDAVSDEADIGYCRQLPLSLGARGWAKEIDQFVKNHGASEYKIDERAKRFDILYMIEMMESIYEN